MDAITWEAVSRATVSFSITDLHADEGTRRGSASAAPGHFIIRGPTTVGPAAAGGYEAVWDLRLDVSAPGYQSFSDQRHVGPSRRSRFSFEQPPEVRFFVVPLIPDPVPVAVRAFTIVDIDGRPAVGAVVAVSCTGGDTRSLTVGETGTAEVRCPYVFTRDPGNLSVTHHVSARVSISAPGAYDATYGVDLAGGTSDRERIVVAAATDKLARPFLDGADADAVLLRSALLPGFVTEMSRVRLAHGATVFLEDRSVAFADGELSASYGGLRRFEERVADTNQLVATIFEELALAVGLRLHEEVWSLGVVGTVRVQVQVARGDLLAGADPSVPDRLVIEYVVRMNDLDEFVAGAGSRQELLDRSRVVVNGVRVLAVLPPD